VTLANMISLYGTVKEWGAPALVGFGISKQTPLTSNMGETRRARHNMACDLMEPVRPHVDAYVLGWIRQETLKREWFFEKLDGNCRLMGPSAARLSETVTRWR